ncbi:hypothetical protein 2A_00029 [Ralstonia phage Darius]|uniref:Tail fiber protein n=2 Tax=Gervaisevirus gervaise TaxID=2846047 RepID=A0A7G5BAD6_9CAUD|nr:tail fiber protein [Ralstonia phage Gervaise]QMV32781.1 hypothetical protein 2A_00029 [Ralstonia phage Darius]QMV33259.1 hypothetical protein 1Ca_00021 [Ralstonia phage Gervaise]
MAIKLSNNAVSHLAAELAQGDTQIILTPGEGSMFPTLGAGDYFQATLAKAFGQYEIVRATARDIDTLTVLRGQENTQALHFAAGDRIELRVTAGVLNALADAVRQIRPKPGDIKMWSGAVANIAAVHGSGWQLADGTNGTIDLRDRFIVGAGASYAPGNTGGANTVAISAEQMPQHNHGVNDPGHNHGVNDPTHAHSVYDPGHSHGHNTAALAPSSTGGGAFQINGYAGGTINASATGIGIYGAATGISIQGAGTGISTQNSGSGAAHENRPPYFALAFIQYTGAGVIEI